MLYLVPYWIIMSGTEVDMAVILGSLGFCCHVRLQSVFAGLNFSFLQAKMYSPPA